MLVYKVKHPHTESSYISGSLGSEGNKAVFKSPIAPEKPRTISEINNRITPRESKFNQNPYKSIETYSIPFNTSADGPHIGELTLFSGECDANYTWYNQKVANKTSQNIKAGTTGFEKRHLVIQKNNKIVLFTKTKESHLTNNAANYE